MTEIDYSLFKQEYHFNKKSDNIVINNQKDLIEFAGEKKLDIDLNKTTILGFRGSTGGCKPPQIDIEVVRDDSKKLYIVKANVYQIGFCKKLIFYQRTFTINKIKKNYLVVFQTNNFIKDKTLLDRDSD